MDAIRVAASAENPKVDRKTMREKTNMLPLSLLKLAVIHILSGRRSVVLGGAKLEGLTRLLELCLVGFVAGGKTRARLSGASFRVLYRN